MNTTLNKLKASLTYPTTFTNVG